MGQEILRQQQELEERIRDFKDEGMEEDAIGEETKDKLRELDEAMKAWENQNEDMMRELGGKVRFCLFCGTADQSNIRRCLRASKVRP